MENFDLRKLQLQVLNKEDIPVRTYHIMFNASEGPKYRLKIGKYIYNISVDGELLETNNQPLFNKDFTPYD
jgi:hypothetical protein